MNIYGTEPDNTKPYYYMVLQGNVNLMSRYRLLNSHSNHIMT